MPQILARDEDNAKRRQRLAKQKRGPGVFVYDGSHFDTDWKPTYLLTGKDEPVYDSRGMPVLDRSGRQQYQPSGQIVTDSNGAPRLGGVPKMDRIPIDVRVIRGVSFPKGEEVAVDADLALKLRCLGGFEEIETKAEAHELDGLGKSALLKLAAKLGLDADKGLSQRALAKLIKAALEEDEPKEVDLKKLGKAALLEFAANEGLEVPEGASKADLVEILEKAKAG